MTNIIGPIDGLDWNTMLLLRKSVNAMRVEDKAKWSNTIEKEEDAYKYILGTYMVA
jgi:hypothetical protein